MAKKNSPNRISKAARTGVRELPSNAAWLLAKAIRPAAGGASQLVDHVSDAAASSTESTRAEAGTVRRRAADAGRSVVDARPGLGRDAVSDLMHEADAAAEQARQSETEAVRLAQRAKDDADQAAQIANDGDRDVQRARKDAEDRVRARVEQLQQELDATVAEVEREQAERV